MTDSDALAGTWKTWPGFSRYEASRGGRIRRRSDGFPMALFPDKDGYLRVTLTGDDGRKCNLSVARCVLTAHEGQCPDGLVSRHWNDDPSDNRWAPGGEDACRAGLGNLVWGTDEQNRADRRRNTPPRPPKPPAACIRCAAPVTKGGRRCHACVEWTGREAARLIREGKRPGEANDLLEYGNVEYLLVLAIKYGDLLHCQPCSCTQDAPQMPADLVSPTVTVTRRSWLRRAFAKWASDGQ